MMRCQLFFVTERWSSFVRTAAAVSLRLSVLGDEERRLGVEDGPGLAASNPGAEANGQLSLRHNAAQYKPRFMVHHYSELHLACSRYHRAAGLIAFLNTSLLCIIINHWVKNDGIQFLPRQGAQFSCSTSAGGPLD